MKAPHTETETTKTDHFPIVNKLYRLQAVHSLSAMEIRSG